MVTGTWILWLSIYWECHHPNWRSPSFFRGVAKNHQPIIIRVIINETSPYIFRKRARASRIITIKLSTPTLSLNSKGDNETRLWTLFGSFFFRTVDVKAPIQVTQPPKIPAASNQIHITSKVNKSYPLVMTNIAMGNGPFIDGLPIRNDDFNF